MNRIDRVALQQLLQEAETLLYREELNIAHQREVIATLQRHGQDAAGAKSFLRRLENSQAQHIADRNRLFKALADRSRGS